MDLLPTGAGPVGLQLLLQPVSSGVFARGACNVAATIYPMYASCKAIESEAAEKEDDTQWLMYWTIYGSLSLIEGTTDKLLSWFPYYYHAKLAFLLWLQLPQFQGAKMLYKDYMKPFILRYQPKVDRILELADQHLGWIIEARKNELIAMGATVKAGVTSILAFGKWFLDTSTEGAEAGKSKDSEDSSKPV